MVRRGYPFVLVLALVAIACEPGEKPPPTPIEEPPPPPKPVVPSAPGAVRAEAEVGGATLTWSAPVEEGGSALTGYQVDGEPREDSLRVTVEGTTARVTGLRAGGTYRFQVSARNGVGVGPARVSEAITLPDVPTAPQGVTATRGNRQVEVAWTAPVSDGGREVRGYLVTTRPEGPQVRVEAPARSAVVGGLTHGVAYRWTVRALNAVGEGPDSPASASVVPASVPSAPVDVDVTAGIREATVTWSEPADTGGVPVVEYVVTTEPEGRVLRQAASARSATFTGLDNGTEYTLRVVARNEVGEGPEAVAPTRRTWDVPRAPIGVTAVRDVRAARVSWEAPPEDGGAPVTGYTVEVQPTGRRVNVGTGARTLTVEGLSSTQTYTFVVSALNAVGLGPESPGSSPMRPVPAAARVSSVEVSDTSAGCVSLAYALEQADGERADVFVEVDARGDGTFRRVTQAGSTDHEGTLARPTSSGGTEHRFLWNRTRDVPGAASVQVRVSARVPGASLASRTVAVNLPIAARRCEPSLDSAQVSVLPFAARSAAVGDFDRDGKTDLLAVLENGGQLALMKGLGNGAFQALPAGDERMGTPSARTPPVAADMNGDGILDLLWMEGQYNTLLVMRGLGGGTFAPARWYSTGSRSNQWVDMWRGLVVDDFDGDGAPDVALVGSDGEVGLFWNQGDGTLDAFTPVLAVGGAGGVLTSADFNGDGRPDLVVSSLSFSSSVLLSRENRRFRRLRVEGLSSAHELLPGDFTGEGHADLITVETTSQAVHLSLLRGNGRGLFSEPEAVATVPVSLSYPHQAFSRAADLDGDGWLDLAVMNDYPGALILLRGRGDGTFTPGARLPSGQMALLLLTADLDADGVPEAMTLQRGGTSLRVWRGGPGRTEQSARTALGGTLASGDLNGDGWTDVVTALQGPARVVVSLGGPQGLSVLEPIAVRDSVLGLQVARVDADAVPDVVVRYAVAGDTVGLLLGHGDGTLRPSAEISVGATAMEADHGDVNGDGRLDLVFMTRRVENGAPLREVRLLLGQGNGGFEPPQVLEMGTDLSQVLFGDVTHDGTLDLLVLRATRGMGAQVFTGRGDGAFTAGPFVRPVSDFAGSRLSLADVNQDGLLDVVFSGSTLDAPPGLHVMKGTGQGAFTHLGFHPTGRSCARMALVDFDADGERDVLCSHGDVLDSVGLIRGAGGGGFHPARGFGTVRYAASELVVLDANGDGLLDVISGSTLAGSNSLLLQH